MKTFAFDQNRDDADRSLHRCSTPSWMVDLLLLRRTRPPQVLERATAVPTTAAAERAAVADTTAAAVHIATAVGSIAAAACKAAAAAALGT